MFANSNKMSKILLNKQLALKLKYLIVEYRKFSSGFKKQFSDASKIHTMHDAFISPDYPEKLLQRLASPCNEAAQKYEEKSIEHKKLQEALNAVMEQCEKDIPIMVGCQEYRTETVKYQKIPFNHERSITKYYHADESLIEKAIKEAKIAQVEWDRVPLEKRSQIWEKAALLMCDKYRYLLNAATVLGQAKTINESENDTACELIDFFNFNSYFLKDSNRYQPISEDPLWNTVKNRGFNGFWAAISPFNYTSIGGNLAYTPALAGNAVLWKPSDNAVLSNWYVYNICREAGVPGGVVNFVPADPLVFSKVITRSPDLSGIHFTGSSDVFKALCKQVGENIDCYRNFPRMIGECGGKNYHFVYEDADIDVVAENTIIAAYGYSGQKCSACSRLYVPDSYWCTLKERLCEILKKMVVGAADCHRTSMSAVINEAAFDRIESYIKHAQNNAHLKIVYGGHCDKTRGYYIEPTLIETTDPYDKLMTEEIFGPVLTVYTYDVNDIQNVVDMIRCQAKYALTAGFFTKNNDILKLLYDNLKYTAGNLAINVKCTGSVVGQQPFGGSAMSGTNDKAGGPNFPLRFTNPITIKENLSPYKKTCK